jgi:hypothetical protein
MILEDKQSQQLYRTIFFTNSGQEPTFLAKHIPILIRLALPGAAWLPVRLKAHTPAKHFIYSEFTLCYHNANYYAAL